MGGQRLFDHPTLLSYDAVREDARHAKPVGNKHPLISVGTWQRSNEIPLQHWFEVGIDVAVLVVAHTGNQALNKLHLLGLRPLVKQGNAMLLLLLIVPL